MNYFAYYEYKIFKFQTDTTFQFILSSSAVISEMISQQKQWTTEWIENINLWSNAEWEEEILPNRTKAQQLLSFLSHMPNEKQDGTMVGGWT